MNLQLISTLHLESFPSLIVYPAYLVTLWEMEVTWNVNNKQYCWHLCCKCCLGCHLEFYAVS